MGRLPLPRLHQSLALASHAAVDQSCHGTHSAHVLAMVAVPLRHGLKAAHAANTMFHPDPPSCKCLIVGHIHCWARFPTRLAVGCGPQALRMQRRDAHIGHVAQAAHPWRQSFQQSGRFEQRRIRHGTTHRGTYIHNAACGFVHGHLRLVRMLLLFPAEHRCRPPSYFWGAARAAQRYR